MTAAAYQIYALQYAHRETVYPEVFYRDHRDLAIGMDYFVWAITDGTRTVVVDLGFTEPVSTRRGRQFLRSPAQGLAEIGIDAAHVEHVIITHFHYDHTGNHALFPRAIFYVQDAEMRFYTGRHAHHPSFAASIEVEDIAALIGLNCEGRLLFVDGEREILPGITVHHVGGHTAGMPVVSVHDLPGVHHAFQRIRDLAGAPGLTIPGHDPLVLTRLVTVAPGIVRATA